MTGQRTGLRRGRGNRYEGVNWRALILWLASYPRSGNTFLYVVLSQAYDIPTLSRYQDKGSLEEIRTSPQLYAVKTHELPDDDSPAIYLARDGRDSLVSYAHFHLRVNQRREHYSQDEFRAALENLIIHQGAFGGWSRHLMEWTSRPAPTAMIHFDDLTAAPVESVLQALDKLGLQIPLAHRKLPSFAELHEQRPDLFRRGLTGSWRDEMPGRHQRFFWKYHAAGMNLLGLEREVCASLIVPTHNSAVSLVRALEPLHILHSGWEILVVDDASVDYTWDYVAHEPVLSWRLEERQGQSRARNLAVGRARGEILVFLDSDVLTSAETLQAMVTFLQENPHWDGVFGCYSESRCPQETSLSRFRNLLHRYVHLCGAGPARSFWAGLGALRRSTFQRHGGFDSQLDGIEDVELGARICRAGGKILLDPRFEGEHLKRWRLGSMVRTDLLLRAAPWTYYGWLGRTPRQGLNLSPRHALAPLLLALSLVWPQLLCLYVLANVPLYRYLLRSGGATLLLPSFLYLAIHHGCCLAGAGLGTLRYLLLRIGFQGDFRPRT